MKMPKRKWSQRVTETSDAMDVAGGTFKQRSAAKIARDVEADAERSTRRKEPAYRSAMSALTFYINRAGKNLSAERRATLERAKEILREEFGPKASARKPAAKPKAGAKGAGKTPARAKRKKAAPKARKRAS